MEEVFADREIAVERGRRLEYFTIVWNSLEGVIAVVSGLLAGSISLVGFGIDSFIELSSGAALLWRMSHDANEDHRERIAKITLKIVGASFLALAGYVAIEAFRDLVSREAPRHSLPGIILACVSLVVMPILARAKRQVAAALRSQAMSADARQTDFCTYLSVILLGGLLLNAIWGLWWADPAAALLMTPIIAREGIQLLRGESCGCLSQ
jgi:divalent metal cation (Fe/Co/Zn/Cd) transporter